MPEGSMFLTNINRLPTGTVLKKKSIGKHGGTQWVGAIEKPNGEDFITDVRSPDLGTVVERLLILKRREESKSD